MPRYRTIWLTARGLRHQQDALAGAPPELDVVMLRQPALAELRPHLADADFLVSERSGVIDRDLIQAAPHLKLIERLGSLAYDIDVDAARAHGVAVTLWPVPTVIAVAEHVVMQMLALAKRLLEVNALAMAAGDWGTSRRTDEDVFAYNWTQRAGIGGLSGCSVGILGFGEIGAELARRLRGWDCSLLYHRRRRLPSAAEDELNLRYAAQTEVLAESDFLVNLLPYGAETDGSLAAAEFAAMRPGSCLVSCGSGSVVDESALAESLRAGHLAGAALDTFEWEPLRPDNPLRLLAQQDPRQNILLTPHTAAGAPPAGTPPSRAGDYTPILRYLRGESLPRRLV